jgi:uncharacterized protein (TIGR02147 family)
MEQSLFDFKDYREFLHHYLKTGPHKAHGFKLKLADHMNVHPTFVTQVFKNLKSFNSEQALKVSEFMELNDLQKDYFLTLVELDRAGTQELKSFINKKILKLRAESLKAKHSVQTYSNLNESDQALFYSQWYYSAIRLLCSLEKSVSRSDIKKHFPLSDEKINQALDFLISRGLVKENNGKLEMAVANTFIPSDSPLVSRHHMNWRLKAIESHGNLKPEELAFTAPISVSEKDFEEIKKILLQSVQKISKIVSQSTPEMVACFNMDLFTVNKRD